MQFPRQLSGGGWVAWRLVPTIDADPSRPAMARGFAQGRLIRTNLGGAKLGPSSAKVTSAPEFARDFRPGPSSGTAFAPE